MTRRDRQTRCFSRSCTALGLLSAALSGTVAQAQQPVPTYRGPAVRQSAPQSVAPIDAPRMGMLEFTPRQVESFGHVTIVGGVARPIVVRTRQATVSLDAVIQRAGGLAKEATGSVTIVRHGQPRMNLFYTPGAGTTLVPGDTVILPARPPALSTAEQARRGPPRVAILCHNVQPHPAILWVPESQASAEEIARALGQTLEALPPRGVVLPTARPTISATLLLPTGTSLYFDPARIDRARLAQALSSGLKFDDLVEFEQASAAADLRVPSTSMAVPPMPLPLPLPSAMAQESSGSLFVPSLPAGPGGSLEAMAPPASPVPALSEPVGAASPVAPLVPASSLEPAHVSSVSSQRIELVRDTSAVAASLERVVPEGPAAGQPAATDSPDDSLEAELAAKPEAYDGIPIIHRAAFGWGLAVGVLVGSLAGLNFWLRSRPKTKKAPRSLSELPLTEEPASIRPQPVHGKVVGDRRLAFDAPHERPASPHFSASAPAARPPLVRTGGKNKVGTKSRSKGAGKVSSKESSESPAEGRAAKVVPPEGGTSAPNGLLDRVLRVMQQERGE